LKDVEEAGIYAVIAPNMAKQIVALQVGAEGGGARRKEGSTVVRWVGKTHLII
jgi:hypothetical protein